MSFSDERERVYRWLRRALSGPPAGLDDAEPVATLNGIKPLERFQTAILFPVASDAFGSDPADDDVEDDAETGLLAGMLRPRGQANARAHPKARRRHAQQPNPPAEGVSVKPDTGDEPDRQTARLVPPDFDQGVDWLPAIELYGEGIFFTLDEDVLQRWEAQEGLLRRAEALQRRFERTGIRFPEDPPLPLPPRFLLMHTLAHLLIRRLETEAGYAAASIRERIYCAVGPEPMAGILVYVAVADVAGSFGGLAELAEPHRFIKLLAGVLDQADWCSLDPVCAEHEGQGPSQLNRAACHACALVPEPSCQFGNVLLDRVFIAGDLGGEIQPLLAYAHEG